MKFARVLIVDDEEPICEVLRSAFSTAGASAISAINAEEALRLIAVQEEAFDVLLIDKNLPGMSGVELIRQVRAADENVAIIMITAYGSAESIVETLNLGIDSYIEKPFASIDELLALTESILLRKGSEAEEAKDSTRRFVASAGDGARVIQVIVAVPGERRSEVITALAPLRANSVSVAFEPELLSAVALAVPDLIVVHVDEWSTKDAAAIKRVRQSAPFAACVVLTSGSLSMEVLKQLVDIGVFGLIEWTADPDWSAKLSEAVEKLRA